jgi:nicotinamide mononucleotide adenylyltransferase
MSKVQKNEFNISGRVLHVGMPKPFSDKFSIRELVMEVFDGKYRNEVLFQYVNDNQPLLNNIRENDWVNVDFRLKGRKVINGGKANWFNSLEAISCTKQ